VCRSRPLGRINTYEAIGAPKERRATKSQRGFVQLVDSILSNELL